MILLKKKKTIIKIEKNTNNTNNTNNRRYLTRSLKYESVLIRANNNSSKKDEDDDDDDWNLEQYRGYRKKTIDIRERKKYASKLNELNSEFGITNYVKYSYATSTAGRDDNGKKKN